MNTAVEEGSRSAFVKSTYGYWAVFVVALVVTQVALLRLDKEAASVRVAVEWPVLDLVVVAGFIGSVVLSRWWANAKRSIPWYFTVPLSALTFAWTIQHCFPPLFVALRYSHGITYIPMASIATLLLIVTMVLPAHVTDQGVPFLGVVLWILLFARLVAPEFLRLGEWFYGVPVVLFSAFVFYDAGNVRRHFKVPFGAALVQFFWTVLLFSSILHVFLLIDYHRRN